MSIVRDLIVGGVALAFGGGAALAGPLLPSSQKTYASACLEKAVNSERLIEICALGLGDAGASAQQRQKMRSILAWQYYFTDENSKAQALFEEMLSDDHRSDEALLGLGWVAYDAADYAQASDLFSQALQLHVGAESVAGLASSLWRSDRIGFEEASQRFQAAQAIDPDYRWALREEAWLNVEHGGTFDRAEVLFQAALKINPDDRYALYGLTYIYTELNRWEEGLEAANKALEIDPTYLSALSRRSLAYLFLDLPKLSLKDGQALIEAAPEDVDGYVRVARAMNALGQRQQALVVLANANAQLGYNAYLVHWLAKFHFFEKSYAKAEAQLNRILAKEEGDYFDYKLLGRIYLGQKDYVQARSAFDRGMELTSDTSWLRYYRSRILIAEGHYNAAEAEFDAAVAEGLPMSKLDRFIANLVGQRQYIQAIKMRVRYENMAD